MKSYRNRDSELITEKYGAIITKQKMTYDQFLNLAYNCKTLNEANIVIDIGINHILEENMFSKIGASVVNWRNKSKHGSNWAAAKSAIKKAQKIGMQLQKLVQKISGLVPEVFEQRDVDVTSPGSSPLSKIIEALKAAQMHSLHSFNKLDGYDDGDEASV